MNGYNFTERVRRVLSLARDDAMRRRHEYVGTEHILSGLIAEGEGLAIAALGELNVDLKRVSQRMDELVKFGKEAPLGPDLPYTSRAKKVLELSMTEARELGHTYVGTEHLLLGLLREERGIGAQVLQDEGAKLVPLRAHIVKLLGNNPARNVSGEAKRKFSSENAQPVTNISISVRFVDGTIVHEEFGNIGAAMRFLALQHRGD